MMTSRSEQCVRGCVEAGVHYAECASFGVQGGDCAGCAPAQPVRDTVVCAQCNRRIRGMLRNAGDLLGRLRSLSAQGKAAVYSHAKVPASPASAPDQVDSALLDAITQIERTLSAWSRLFDIYTLRGLDEVLADPEQVERLWSALFDIHLEDDDGVRWQWSLADAASKWGIERRDRYVYPGSAGAADEVDITVTPVTEWHNPLLTARDAARRAGVTERQLRKWVQADMIKPAAKVRDARGVVTRWFRASEIDHTAEVMKNRRHAGLANPPG